MTSALSRNVDDFNELALTSYEKLSMPHIGETRAHGDVGIEMRHLAFAGVATCRRKHPPTR
jgi:hypothetical protein